jgi:hypothetical protein
MSKLHIVKGTFRKDAIRESPSDDSIIVPMRIAQVGIREYLIEKDFEFDYEFYIQREAFLPEHLFRQETLDTAKGVVATHYHPWDMINSNNWDWEMKGVTIGEATVEDNQFIAMDVKVFDPTMKAYILSEMSDGVSMGYYCDVIPEAGELNGQPYDAYVENIRFNHLAFCAREDARGGEELGVKLDTKDLKELPDTSNVILDKDLGYKTAFLEKVQKFRRDTQNKAEVQNMKDYRLDGKSYSIPDEIAARIDTLVQDGQDASAKLDTVNKELTGVKEELATEKTDKAELQKKFDTTEGERDGLQEKVTGLETEKTDLQTKLDAAPKEEDIIARINLSKQVSEITGEEVDIKMDVTDMRKKALEKLCDGIDLEGKSADYIEARYDTVIEKHEEEGFPVVEKRTDTDEEPGEKPEGTLRIDSNGHASNHFSNKNK